MDTDSEHSSNESLRVIDQISALPDEIRVLILGYLPITDMVRTSALSKAWRYSWKRAEQLNLFFDDNIDIEMDDDQYYKVVGNVLLSHVGPVHKCVLRVTERCYEEELNGWVRFLSRRGIKDLTIQSGYGYDRCDLPPSIFKCLGLTCLTLGAFNLENSIAFNGFPNLVRLNLIYVEICGDMLEKVVSSCPLEILLIEDCCFHSGWNGRYIRKSVISSRSLRVLNIACSCFSLCHSHLKYTPNIRVASFTMDTLENDDEKPSNCFDFLRSMPKIEDFTFDCRLHKTSTSDVLPKKLPLSLESLKTLTLYGVDVLSMDQLVFIFLIFRSSPNLQNLTIHMAEADWHLEKISEDCLKTALAFIETNDNLEIKTNITTLSVTLEDMELIRADMSLIANILSWSPTLEKLLIKEPSVGKDSVELELSKAVSRAAMKSGRSSANKPAIIYF